MNEENERCNFEASYLEHNVTHASCRTNFLPYEYGLTLHVHMENNPDEIVYRLQWREEEQADIIEHFNDFVQTC